VNDQIFEGGSLWQLLLRTYKTNK